MLLGAKKRTQWSVCVEVNDEIYCKRQIILESGVKASDKKNIAFLWHLKTEMRRGSEKG